MPRGFFPRPVPPFSRVMFDTIVCGGGLDQVTPTLSLPNGYAKYALNFACGVNGGYERIGGYERFDGHTSPSSVSIARKYISVSSYTNTPAVGNTLTSSGGATGVIAYIDGLVMVVVKITGAFAVGETVSVGATLIGTVDSVDAGPVTPKQQALATNAIADIYRADISAVPGSGPVRGVIMYNDVVYAFRNNALGTACDIYKSSGTGWTSVPLFKTVSFTAGGATAPADGATLTQGGVTAVIKRVARTSGSWAANSAAGQFIIATPAGGSFIAGAATIGAVNVTLSGAESQLTLLPGGKFDLVEANFTGSATTKRIYGCDGVNHAFEFDGTILVPIYTGAAVDTPTHVLAHRNYLWLSLGASVMYSAPGLPYDWTALGGAGENATGDTVTGMITMPGGTTTGTLGIFSRVNTSILYGNSSSDFNLVAYNTGTGATAWSVQNMAQTLAFDDRGAVSIQASLQYGNFAQTSLTTRMVPFVNERINLLNCSSLNRRKSQYRLFFSDGYGLYITLVNGKLLGAMPVKMAHSFYCAFEGRTTTGEDVNFVGGTDGYVYQLDKGSSFDGSDIDFMFTLNFSTARGPRVLKHYRKAAVEMATESNTYIDFGFGYAIGYGSVERVQPPYEEYGKYIGVSRWDAFYWDDFFWDTSGIAPSECDLGGTAENIAITISGSADYIMPFTVNSVIVHYTPRRIMR